MVLMTLIGRVSDGLPLATSTEGDEQHDYSMVKYTNQAKMLFRKLNSQSPSKCTLETGQGSYVFHYIIELGVCYLCLCEQNYPSKMAFKYLAEIQSEFQSRYGDKVATVSRPYHFIEFDAVIQSARRRYGDGRNRLTAVSNELQQVQNVMVQNIEDVIHRGEALNILDDKAANLRGLSEKYRKDARYLNMRSWYAQLMVGGIVIVMLLLYFRFWW